MCPPGQCWLLAGPSDPVSPAEKLGSGLCRVWHLRVSSALCWLLGRSLAKAGNPTWVHCGEFTLRPVNVCWVNWISGLCAVLGSGAWSSQRQDCSYTSWLHSAQPGLSSQSTSCFAFLIFTFPQAPPLPSIKAWCLARENKPFSSKVSKLCHHLLHYQFLWPVPKNDLKFLLNCLFSYQSSCFNFLELPSKEYSLFLLDTESVPDVSAGSPGSCPGRSSLRNLTVCLPDGLSESGLQSSYLWNFRFPKHMHNNPPCGLYFWEICLDKDILKPKGLEDLKDLLV